jgi:hypothetical protein
MSGALFVDWRSVSHYAFSTHQRERDPIDLPPYHMHHLKCPNIRPARGRTLREFLARFGLFFELDQAQPR